MARPRSPRGRARVINERLRHEYPGDAAELCELDHANAFELLVATILSAQCTDKRVNMVTPELFARWPTAEDLSVADPDSVREVIRTTGFFQSKTKNLLGMATRVSGEFGGDVPGAMADLVSLPGVGRKTANVVRSVALGLAGLPVDTHVLRLAGRLGISESTDPVKLELELNDLVKAEERGTFSLRVILHGRRVCSARAPACDSCVLVDVCPSAHIV